MPVSRLAPHRHGRRKNSDGRSAATTYFKKNRRPRSNERWKPLGRGMSFRIYRLAEKEGEKGGSARALRKQLLYERTPAFIYEDASQNRLKRAQEFEKGFLICGLELFKFFGDMFRFAAMAENGVEKGVGSAVMHETRVQADTPERSGADFVGGIVEFGNGEVSPGDAIHVLAVMLGHGLNDAVAGADVVEQEVAVGVKLLGSEGGING